MNIQSLSTPERILFAGQLWDSVHSHSDEISLSPAQIETLNNRLSALELDGDVGDKWSNVKKRIIGNSCSI